MEETEASSVTAALEMDPETEFMLSGQGTGNEWELFKENVRPLKRGRNVKLLNHALRSHNSIAARKSLLETRRRMIEAIDEYRGEDPLQPWLECIKWVQESFPTGGDLSGLVVIYEQCVRTFWHNERYKDDQRYLKAEICKDAEVIYKFLQANQIGQNHSAYYIAYSRHLESMNKLRTADEIFNLGIARKAKTLEKLEAAYRKFLARSMTRTKIVDVDAKADDLPARSFGIILDDRGGNRQTSEHFDANKRRKPLERLDKNSNSLSIYNTEENSDVSHGSKYLSMNDTSWHSLGGQSSRNKENISAPTKWSTYKVPQKMSTRTEPTTASTRIEVFVDEECAEKSEYVSVPQPLIIPMIDKPEGSYIYLLTRSSNSAEWRQPRLPKAHCLYHCDFNKKTPFFSRSELYMKRSLLSNSSIHFTHLMALFVFEQGSRAVEREPAAQLSFE
ncbi:checkpoint serine/threonine-protein kinase [Apostasia shenzhenica]|uniref:Checkpoint serine/threonine-protein kinase n=1 Tax=Apostasia shenzhenica TaxID=1088818 RepID=A0A2I0AM76_9ASPA|nr:checkpoint serine/threonine-protein kinase [Apostasia shenzhenica]